MNNIKVGEVIGIRCEVKPGPFPDEYLIQVNTVNGPVSGFVMKDQLNEKSDGWLVRGVVRQVYGETIEVMIQGSFFTTNGIATIPQQLAMAA